MSGLRNWYRDEGWKPLEGCPANSAGRVVARETLEELRSAREDESRAQAIDRRGRLENREGEPETETPGRDRVTRQPDTSSLNNTLQRT